MKRRCKLVVLGNSVAIRVRPHIKEKSKNYGQRLQGVFEQEDKSVNLIVDNMGFGRATIEEILWKKDDIVSCFGDYYVINAGVVDAASREIPLWWADVNNNKKKGVLRFFFANLFNFVVKPRRRLFTKLRGSRSWVSAKTFRARYEELIDLIQKNTSGRVICLTISPATDRVERELPGSRKRYIEFNNIIESVVEEKGGVLLSVDRIGLEQERDFPDGTHYSDAGHEQIAKQLYMLLTSVLHSAT